MPHVKGKCLNIMLWFIQGFISSAFGTLYVGFYNLPNYDSFWTYCNLTNFDSDDICNLTAENDYRSLRFHIGTCVEMNDSKKSVWITENQLDLGHSFKEGYAKKCETFDKNLTCPDGSFVKQVEWDSSTDMTRGIRLSCYQPGFFQNSATILESHPGSQFLESEKRKCPAIYGITFKIDNEKDANVGLDFKENCTAGYAPGVRTFCEENTAISGINFIIEKRTNYIKNSTIICSKIPDIAATCKATDEKQILLSYNGSNATVAVTFNVEKKFGVGYSLVMSKFNRNEFEFYNTSNFEIGESIPELSNNFRKNLGISNTGFDWNSSPDNIWQIEQTVNMKVKIDPGCTTEVIEIVGKCSFLEVRLAQYLRVDNCNGETNENTIVISDNIVDRTYNIKFPNPIKKNAIKETVQRVNTNNAYEVVVKPRPLTMNIELISLLHKYMRMFGM